jgi:hypothetical protein
MTAGLLARGSLPSDRLPGALLQWLSRSSARRSQLRGQPRNRAVTDAHRIPFQSLFGNHREGVISEAVGESRGGQRANDQGRCPSSGRLRRPPGRRCAPDLTGSCPTNSRPIAAPISRLLLFPRAFGLAPLRGRGVSGVRDARPPFGLERNLYFIRLPRVPDTAAVLPTSRDLHIRGLAAADALEASPLAGAALGGMPPLARSALSGRPWITDRPESRSGGWPALPGPGQVPTFGRRPPPAPLPLGAPHLNGSGGCIGLLSLYCQEALVQRSAQSGVTKGGCSEIPEVSPVAVLRDAACGGSSGRGSGIFILHPIAGVGRQPASPSGGTLHCRRRTGEWRAVARRCEKRRCGLLVRIL